ncbi:MAG TPA: heavy-metal-associated domain-containing protein [Micromonosporaceae bacterium]|jgi:copper chaperone CopZ|nr:heavy-metal-associated domain-containing protein [Micromonosporaceae bacterium]
MSVQATYAVSGMTCGHCAQSVGGELSKLDGVTNVDVNLAAGAVTVTSETPLVEQDVRAAVDEAGYELATS